MVVTKVTKYVIIVIITFPQVVNHKVVHFYLEVVERYHQSLCQHCMNPGAFHNRNTVLSFLSKSSHITVSVSENFGC
eukprot:m.71223 g.71223  ORF g.71223 m.71223 type:complete len:77 (-) comp8338_c7_seq2:2386-2616(-)